ncbi:MAG: hypothetical protein ABIJ08_04855 [Nanoarchaeota archaeon]
MVKKITKTQIIASYLNDYSRSYYLRELASLLKKSHQTIKPYVELLVKEKILIKTERKNIIEFKLNFKNKRLYDYLVIAEKEKLIARLENDTLLRVLYDKINGLFNDNTFIIFGSSVNQIEKAADIDLLVIGRKDIKKEIEDFEEVYNKKIHKVQTNDFKKLGLTLIKEIYAKHLIFNNTEKVIRSFGELYEKNKLV